MFPYLFSVGSEANVKQCVLFVLGRPAVYLLFISIIRNETCTFRISYNNSSWICPFVRCGTYVSWQVINKQRKRRPANTMQPMTKKALLSFLRSNSSFSNVFFRISSNCSNERWEEGEEALTSSNRRRVSFIRSRPILRSALFSLSRWSISLTQPNVPIL